MVFSSFNSCMFVLVYLSFPDLRSWYSQTNELRLSETEICRYVADYVRSVTLLSKVGNFVIVIFLL
jgi:hypothetical protein